MENEALVVQGEQENDPLESSVHLVARDPAEMAAARNRLQAWLSAKVRECEIESGELGDAVEVAMKNNWQFETLRKHCNLAAKRADFYRKVGAAVEAGYTIVPNFPVDFFAIRVRRQHPRQEQTESRYNRQHAVNMAHEVGPDILAAGEGRYESNRPRGITGDFTVTESGKEITKHFFAVKEFSEIVFPIEAARPVVMSATAEAMALRVFDAVGICPQTRKGDPLIIGKIFGRHHGRVQSEVSFMIAWHLDLRTL